MPPYNGVRLHQHQRRAPVPPDSNHGDPEQSVAGLKAGAFRRAFHRHQLLPQREVLQDQFPMSVEGQCQSTTDDDEQLQHAPMVVGVGEKINVTNSGEDHRGVGLEREMCL